MMMVVVVVIMNRRFFFLVLNKWSILKIDEISTIYERFARERLQYMYYLPGSLIMYHVPICLLFATLLHHPNIYGWTGMIIVENPRKPH